MLLVALFGTGVFLHAHLLLQRSPRVQETLEAQQIARLIVERLGADTPLTYVDSPFAVQFYLNRIRPPVSFQRAADLLRGNAAAWVVVRDFARLELELGPGDGRFHEVMRWPLTGEPWIRVVGNHPFPITNQPVALLIGDIRVEEQFLHLEHPRQNYRRGTALDFRGNAAQGRLRIENQGDSPRAVRIRIFDETAGTAATEVESNLPPGATWTSFAQTMR
jgi:hypothetical protein